MLDDSILFRVPSPNPAIHLLQTYCSSSSWLIRWASLFCKDGMMHGKLYVHRGAPAECCVSSQGSAACVEITGAANMNAVFEKGLAQMHTAAAVQQSVLVTDCSRNINQSNHITNMPPFATSPPRIARFPTLHQHTSLSALVPTISGISTNLQEPRIEQQSQYSSRLQASPKDASNSRLDKQTEPRGRWGRSLADGRGCKRTKECPNLAHQLWVRILLSLLDVSCSLTCRDMINILPCLYSIIAQSAQALRAGQTGPLKACRPFCTRRAGGGGGCVTLQASFYELKPGWYRIDPDPTCSGPAMGVFEMAAR